MNMMNFKIWNLVIRISAVFFKTGYMQSPYKNLNSAKFYHPKPKHSVSNSVLGEYNAIF